MRRPLQLTRVDGLAERGLSEQEALARRGIYGANDIIEIPVGRWRRLAGDTARDPMLWFLLATSAVFGVLKDYTEALTLLAAIVPLIGMDAYLHRRTQASTEGLQSRLATHATVLRDGASMVIPAADLTPGDLALVAAGEPFPADGLILRGDNLQVDESALTGEAYPVRKKPLGGPPNEASVDTMHWGFAGTRLLTGEARLRVIYTGAETLYGEIVRSALAGRHARTPLQQAIAHLVTVLLVAAAITCVILAAVRLQQGYGLLDAILSAVTLAVAALPEEFPVVFTFFLGVGVYRLAKRQALVRRSVVVENIGRVSAICSDKTGTLTEGRLQITHRLPAEGIDETRLLGIAAMASRPESGDPLDHAVLELARQPAGRLLATFPFTEDRKRETAVMEDNGALTAAVKGAPEVVLSMAELTPQALENWRHQVVEFATTGHKVIACAWRELGKDWAGGEPDRGYHFAGLLACEDPVREGVAEAVQDCKAADIRVVMVTGDHPDTALAIAREIGLGGDSASLITGEELEARLAHEGTDLDGVDVIARAVPSQKLALVQRLQADGEIVAVTGDGVNDVPALQAADIGIAMGERGTRSAREVAAIVLLDDNFRTIVRAVAEGRQLFHNLRLSFAYLLMIHIPLVVSAALIPLLGYPLLYLPIHIVWLELIIHPTALLVFQQLPPSKRVAPARQGTRFFSNGEWLVIAVVGILITGVVAGGYERSLGIGGNVEHARAMAMVALTVASATLTASLSGLRTAMSRIMVVVTVGLSVVLVQTPVLDELLNLTALHLDDWGTAIFGGLLAAILPALTWGRKRI